MCNRCGTNITERFITSGADVRLTYQLNLRDVVGGAITPVYVYGLTPADMKLLKLCRPHTPGNSDSDIDGKGRCRAAVYPVIERAGWQLPGHQLCGECDVESAAAAVPIFRRLHPSHSGESAGAGHRIQLRLLRMRILGSATTGYSPVQDRTRITAAMERSMVRAMFTEAPRKSRTRFRRACNFSLSIPCSRKALPPQRMQPSLGFTRNQFGGGIRFNLGNPITRGGVQ